MDYSQISNDTLQKAKILWYDEGVSYTRMVDEKPLQGTRMGSSEEFHPTNG